MVSRFEGEKVFIDCPNGDRIEITFHDIRTTWDGKDVKRKKVRVAIDAPRSYRIMRSELVER